MLLVLPWTGTSSTLFPYTTLFRSRAPGLAGEVAGLSGARAPRGGHPPDDRHRHRVQRAAGAPREDPLRIPEGDRKSTRLNSSHSQTSYAVFCLKKKRKSTQSSTS